MIDNYDLFNKKLTEFVDDLVYIFPEVHDFRILKRVLSVTIEFQKPFAQTMFNNCVAKPYSKQINEKDETFLLQETYEEYDQYIKEYQNDLNLVQKLKNIWKDLDHENKETIWTYFQVLLILNERCLIENKTDLKESLNQ